MTADTTEPAPSILARATTALVVPPILGALFLPIFRAVQGQGFPTGSLEGIDLTPFAERDERMMLAFAAVLVLFAFGVCIGARSWRHRIMVGLVAIAAAAVSYVAVFAALFAG